MIVDKERFRKHLGSIIRDIVTYYNRLTIEEGLLSYASPRIVNGPFRKQPSSFILELTNPNSNEPGLTVHELAVFNTSVSERFEHFIDRFAEFFYIYGIMLTQYDSGELYIFVEDVTKYQELLKDIEHIEDTNAVMYLIRKIEIGLDRTIREIPCSIGDFRSEYEQDEVIDRRYGALLRSIPALIAYHEKYDTTPVQEQVFIRKRIVLSAEAFSQGCIKDFLMLWVYLKPDDVGDVSRLDYLSNGELLGDVVFVSSWKLAFDIISATITRRGSLARPVLDKVFKNLQDALGVLDPQIKNLAATSQNKEVAFYQKKLKSLLARELKEPLPHVVVEPEPEELVEQKMNHVIDLIHSYFFTKDELAILKKKIKALKVPTKKDFPF